MSVKFNNEQYGQQQRRPMPGKPEKGITGMLIKNGIVKNKKQANYLQIGIIVVLAIVMIVALRSL